MDVKNRVKGAFFGFIFGSGVNARFSPMLTPEEARSRYGKRSFADIPKDYKLYDQYTKTKIIYDILLKNGRISPEIYSEYLLELHRRDNVFRDDVYGPSTQKAVKAIMAGEDLYEIGRTGITCGAAMSGLPIGMFFYNDMEALIQNTVNSCIISHNTDVAIDAAIATNATLAGLLRGMKKIDAVNEGIKMSKDLHGKFGEKTTEPKIYERIQTAIDLVKGKTLDESMLIIAEKIGVSWFARETIPGAFANYVVANSPEDSCLLAMRCGGDNETVPEIACAFMGAERGPGIFSKEIIRRIKDANKINVNEMVEKLIDRMNL